MLTDGINPNINLVRSCQAYEFVRAAQKKYPGVNVADVIGYSSARLAAYEDTRLETRIVTKEISSDQAQMLEGMILAHIKEEQERQERLASSPPINAEPNSSSWCVLV